jgi:hypothetical protein
MMLPEASSSQYTAQQAVTGTTAGAVAKLWRRMGDEFDTSWQSIRPQLLDVVQAGRAAAVAVAAPYTASVLKETGQADDAVGSLNLAAFTRTAPDGRDIGTLYDQSVIKAKTAVASGMTTEAALALAGRWMTMATLTTLADTRRMVYQADMIQRPTLTGFTRMLNPPSCNRCIILAGKWFRWNEGFQRHPSCDCIHVPASENVAGDIRTDPYAMFKSMSPDEQERVFGRSEARAIREGADIYKATNQSVRKLKTANSAIDNIYRNAGTRTNAIRMLREQGFILERGQVVVPLSPGVRTDAQILAAGRGRGAVTLAGQTVTTDRAARFDAAQSGQRDPLRRSTMTAAERRLYDANYRLQYALRTGTIPRSIGPSSADRYANPIPATPAKIAELREALNVQLGLLNKASTPDSVRRLARLLGL